MDFSIPQETQDLLARIRAFVNTELIPIENEFVSKSFTELKPLLEEKRDKVRALGLSTPQLEKEWGGLGLSVLEHGLVSAELGRTPIGHYVFNCQAPDSGNMEILLKFGNEAQKERWLKPLAAGKIRSCFSRTEPDFPGSNPVWMGTTAVREGNEWVINGRKWFTSSADGAAFAVVMAVTDPSAAPHFRASMIIVPTDTPGFKLVENTPCMGHRGDDWHSHSEIIYENCRVPAENLLGPEGAGFMIAQERLGPGRIHHCMRWIGICERSFELLVTRAMKRKLSPDKTLATKQIIQAWIAECRADINAARLMVLHAAWCIDKDGPKAAREEISLIKFFVANTMMKVIDRALQAHGGLGITDYTPLAFFYRNERASRIYDGADEVHKVSVSKKIIQRFEREMENA